MNGPFCLSVVKNNTPMCESRNALLLSAVRMASWKVAPSDVDQYKGGRRSALTELEFGKEFGQGPSHG